MANAQIKEGKVRIGMEISPDVYAEWKESGMNAAYVFQQGLRIAETRAKANELANLVNLANEEINKKNERIFFLGEKVKELNGKLVEYQKKEEEQAK